MRTIVTLYGMQLSAYKLILYSKFSGICGQINCSCDRKQNHSRTYFCMVKVKGRHIEDTHKDRKSPHGNQF